MYSHGVIIIISTNPHATKALTSLARSPPPPPPAPAAVWLTAHTPHTTHTHQVVRAGAQALHAHGQEAGGRATGAVHDKPGEVSESAGAVHINCVLVPQDVTDQATGNWHQSHSRSGALARGIALSFLLNQC